MQDEKIVDLLEEIVKRLDKLEARLESVILFIGPPESLESKPGSLGMAMLMEKMKGYDKDGYPIPKADPSEAAIISEQIKRLS